MNPIQMRRDIVLLIAGIQVIAIGVVSMKSNLEKIKSALDELTASAQPVDGEYMYDSVYKTQVLILTAALTTACEIMDKYKFFVSEKAHDKTCLAVDMGDETFCNCNKYPLAKTLAETANLLCNNAADGEGEGI